MNKIIPVIAIVFAFTLGIVFSADLATAVKPATEVFVTNDNANPIPVTATISSNPACPAENVQHWNKIVFVILETTYTHPTLPDLIGFHTYEMIVQVNPDDINEPKLIVAKKLNADGYLENGQPVNPNVEVSAGLEAVSYSTICAEN